MSLLRVWRPRQRGWICLRALAARDSAAQLQPLDTMGTCSNQSARGGEDVDLGVLIVPIASSLGRSPSWAGERASDTSE